MGTGIKLAIVVTAATLFVAGSTLLYYHFAIGSSLVTVDDRATLFSTTQKTGIVDYHSALHRTHDIDYRVLTLRGDSDIEGQAYKHFNDSGVGSLSSSGRGLLLVIDVEQNQVRLEVSTALEPVYTDAFVAYIQHRQMLPFFQSGRVADGILATTELIVTRAQEAVAGKDFVPPMESLSMGGGATAPARINEGGDPSEAFKQQTQSVDAAEASPEQVVGRYLDAMAQRDARHDLSIYSNATIQMLKDWTVTPAQMDNVVRTYAKCRLDRVLTEGDRAVVRYPPDQRLCAPYFLQREQGAWKLDLTVMSSLIRFNHNNQWRFASNKPHPYSFAFADWGFDSKGFPRAN